jgi:hypothetical protein
MNTEVKEKNLATSDLATAAETPTAQREVDQDVDEPAAEKRKAEAITENEQLASLFSPEAAKEFRARWDAIQSSFVDDPKRAVRQGDELVAQVMESLTETFSNERSRLEGQLDQSDKASTENLRVALRRYRSFFERLLAL